MNENIGIYKIIAPSGKIYIGQSANLSARVFSYKNYPHKSFKNGLIGEYYENNCQVEKFNFEIICNCLEHELNPLEYYFINLFESTNPNKGFNISKGGNSRKNRGQINDELLAEIDIIYGKPYLSKKTIQLSLL